MMLKHLIALLMLFVTYSAQGVSLSEMKVFGSSSVNSETDDLWDKKNSAIYDSKKRATFNLAARVLKPEAVENLRKDIKRKILPLSSRYLVSSTVLSHGLEETDTYKVYNAHVSFKYSLENFKNLLKSKGFPSELFQKHKVAAFIEVMDIGQIRTFSWWNEQKPELHPVLKPLQLRLAKALKEEGYELMPIRLFRGQFGMKDMARFMGAQYYISGFIKIKKGEGAFKVKDGVFNFHEALSQKLVSKVDLKKFSTATRAAEEPPSRGIASVRQPQQNKDLLKQAFKDAVKTMNASENVDHLSHGVAELSFSGLQSPLEMFNIKKVIMTSLKEDIISLVERKISDGEVTFVARTQLSPQRLLSLMNSSNIGLGSYRGVMKEDGKTLHFSIRN